MSGLAKVLQPIVRSPSSASLGIDLGCNTAAEADTSNGLGKNLPSQYSFALQLHPQPASLLHVLQLLFPILIEATFTCVVL